MKYRKSGFSIDKLVAVMILLWFLIFILFPAYKAAREDAQGGGENSPKTTHVVTGDFESNNVVMKHVSGALTVTVQRTEPVHIPE